MKKGLIFLGIVLCIFLAGCNSKEKTIEEITGVNFDDISYIKTKDIDYDVNEFISYYQNAKFQKITEKNIGSTTHLYFVCYDNNDNVLFTLVSVGNQDKYIIKKGSYNTNTDSYKFLYQMVRE